MLYFYIITKIQGSGLKYMYGYAIFFRDDHKFHSSNTWYSYDILMCGRWLWQEMELGELTSLEEWNMFL